MVFGMRHPCYRPQELPRVPFPGHPDRHTPDDIRPAFPYDVDRCRRLLSDAYGCGETPFLDDCVVLLFGKETSPNGLSVVAHGRIVARIHQDMDGRETVHLTFDGAVMAAPNITRGHVRVKRSAVPYILNLKHHRKRLSVMMGSHPLFPHRRC